MLRSYFFIVACFCNSAFLFGENHKIYVDPDGVDTNPGIEVEKPKKSFDSALEPILKFREDNTGSSEINLLPGEYRISKTIEITVDHDALVIRAAELGTVRILGSKIINGQWKKHKGEIMKLKTSFPISSFAQLYINGDQQVLVRYLNIDSALSHYRAYAADAIDPDRIAKWEHPEGVIVHAMHRGEWGGLEEGDAFIHCKENTINNNTDLLSLCRE